MGGYNIVMDVNSGAIHVVDDLTYDMIAMYEDADRESIFTELETRYPEQAGELDEAWEEVTELIAAGELFTPDNYESYIEEFAERPVVVKALCLHIAHDCNLACRYCFAEEGEYHGRRELMSFDVGRKFRQPQESRGGFFRRGTAYEFSGRQRSGRVRKVAGKDA